MPYYKTDLADPPPVPPGPAPPGPLIPMPILRYVVIIALALIVVYLIYKMVWGLTSRVPALEEFSYAY